jgi:hypothetical protein
MSREEFSDETVIISHHGHFSTEDLGYKFYALLSGISCWVEFEPWRAGLASAAKLSESKFTW